jgi:hypothetical protein
LKQALIVDPRRSIDNFAALALSRYSLNRVDSLQEAFALAATAHYDLVCVAETESQCPGAIWAMVELISQYAEDAMIAVIPMDAADEVFHAKARALGAVVLSAPWEVAVPSAIEETTLG